MSASASSISSSSFVQGYLYETSVYTDRGRPLPNTLTIHIPNLNLHIEIDSASRTTAPMTSVQALEACDAYMERIRKRGLKYDDREYLRIQDEVNQSVQVAIQLPAEIVHEIDTLVGPGVMSNAHTGPNGARILELSGRLFSAIKAEFLAIQNVGAIVAARVSINKVLQEQV